MQLLITGICLLCISLVILQCVDPDFSTSQPLSVVSALAELPAQGRMNHFKAFSVQLCLICLVIEDERQ